MTAVDDRLYVVADKEWNRYIYQVSLQERTFSITDTIGLNFEDDSEFRLDIEGIAHCNGTFYLINEKGNQVMLTDLAGSIKILYCDYTSINEDPTVWSKNAGYEGIAVDCQNSIIYLGKERDPRFLISMDLKTGAAIKKYDLGDEHQDVSDLWFENGFLYVLERANFRIIKIDVTKMEVVDYVSYAEVCNPPEGKLFEPSEYGMAEALLLTDREIWIGLDNNSVRVSGHAQLSYGISGNNPVILIFERPEGF